MSMVIDEMEQEFRWFLKVSITNTRVHLDSLEAPLIMGLWNTINHVSHLGWDIIWDTVIYENRAAFNNIKV